MKNNFKIVKSWWVWLLFLIIASSCQQGLEKRNIRAFYYPIHTFSEGKVYEYRSLRDSLAPFYWYFRSFERRGDTILTSEYFDHNFTIKQLSNEEMVRNGMVQNDLFFYETDSLTGKQLQNAVRIEVDNTFPFEVTDEQGLFLYKIFWKDYYQPDTRYRLIRNRHYLGDTTITWQGKPLECVQFLNRELLEVEEVGFQELRYQTTELFGKGIGLVYSKKVIADGLVQEYMLHDIYEMADLERKYQQAAE